MLISAGTLQTGRWKYGGCHCSASDAAIDAFGLAQRSFGDCFVIPCMIPKYILNEGGLIAPVAGLIFRVRVDCVLI